MRVMGHFLVGFLSMREFADVGLWRPSILICTMLFTMVAMLKLPKRFGATLLSRADEPRSMNPPNRGLAAHRLDRTNPAAPYVEMDRLR